ILKCPSELLEAQRNSYLRLQSENRSLELRYDRLKSQKRRVTAGWRKDWKMWKRCKDALLEDKEKRSLVLSRLQGIEEDCEYEKSLKKLVNNSEGKGGPNEEKPK